MDEYCTIKYTRTYASASAFTQDTQTDVLPRLVIYDSTHLACVEYVCLYNTTLNVI